MFFLSFLSNSLLHYTLLVFDSKRKKNYRVKNAPFADSRECSELNASSPDLNQGPLDLQSNALPTELSRLDWVRSAKK